MAIRLFVGLIVFTPWTLLNICILLIPVYVILEHWTDLSAAGWLYCSWYLEWAPSWFDFTGRGFWVAHYIKRCAALYNMPLICTAVCIYIYIYMYEVYYSKKSGSSQSLIQQIAVTALPNITYILACVLISICHYTNGKTAHYIVQPPNQDLFLICL